MKRINLDELKEKYLNKTFGWLTVVDAFRDDKRRIKFKCVCKCGKECIKDFGKVITGHTSSCGCFKFTEDYSNKLKTIMSTKQSIIRERSDKFKQWCKDNPDKIKERSNKYKKTLLAHPEILEAQKTKRKKTLEENPEIQKKINEKLRQFYCDENNRKRLSDAIVSYHTAHPELNSRISDSLKKHYKDNPDARKEISIRAKKWAEDNKEKVKELGKQHSESLRQRRLYFISKAKQLNPDSFNTFVEALHPSQVDDLLSGVISAKSIIKTKCPTCGKYEEHTFNSVWKLSTMEFRTGRPPSCELCRCQMFSSSFEDEIVNIISLLCNYKCIRNSRDIISPFELDIYYPEKRIAVEFNGSYWHNENCKPKDYHYNKFMRCYKSGITLVSIFDRDWHKSKNKIISYLADLFNGKVNFLSYKRNNTTIVNLNYPLPNLNLLDFNNFEESFYVDRGSKVYMCGYAIKAINTEH